MIKGDITDAMRQKVRTLTACGVLEDDVAKIVGMSIEDVRINFEKELDQAAVEADARVAGALYKNAVDGDTSVQVFWLKTRDAKRKAPSSARIGNGYIHKPASGTPASGKPAQAFSGNYCAGMPKRPDGKQRKEWRDNAAWQMEHTLHEIALTAEHEPTRVQAATALHKICEPPVQRIVTENVVRPITEYTDAELAAIAGEGEASGLDGITPPRGSTH